MGERRCAGTLDGCRKAKAEIVVKKTCIHALQVAIALAVAFGVLVLLGPFWPSARVMGLFITGSVKDCSWEQSLRGARIEAFEKRTSASLGRSSRVIRKESGLSLVDTPRGPFWIPSGSERTLYQDLAEQDWGIYGQGAEGVRRGDVVLDCGANIGLFTRMALRAGARLVVAIEPAPENIECLRRNLAPEIAKGLVIVYPKGVWHEDGLLTLNVNAQNSAADSFVMKWAVGREGPKMPVTTIDHLVAELKLPHVDIVKMDIEGSERNALMGARATLIRDKSRMAICVYHLPDDYEVITRLVADAAPGYLPRCQCYVERNSIRPHVVRYSRD